MSDDHNLTPEQRAMPPSIRHMAYQQVPRTCDTVRGILDEMGREITAAYGLKPEDHPTLDAAISRAFLAIRDRATQPLRTAQMRAISNWAGMAKLLPRTEGKNELGYTEHPFEGDLYAILGTEFGKPRAFIKQRLFVVLFGMAYANGTEEGKRPLLDRCRDALRAGGLIPLAEAKKIRFTHDEELLVEQGPLQFGAIEDESFEAGEEYDVTSVTPCEAPNTDMATVVFKHGKKAQVPIESFEVVN